MTHRVIFEIRAQAAHEKIRELQLKAQTLITLTCTHTQTRTHTHTPLPTSTRCVSVAKHPRLFIKNMKAFYESDNCDKPKKKKKNSSFYRKILEN